MVGTMHLALTPALAQELLARLPQYPVLQQHNRRVTALAAGYCEHHGVPYVPEVFEWAGLLHDLMVLVPFRQRAWNSDYVSESAELARAYLTAQGELGPEQIDLVAGCIRHHHDIRRHPHPVIDAFRRADWHDVSASLFRLGIPGERASSIRSKHPAAGLWRMLGRIFVRFMVRPANYIRIFLPRRTD
jgi:HD domain-containing protein